MFKKLYSFIFQLYYSLILIGFTIHLFYSASIEPSIKTELYMLGAIIGVLFFYINYDFYRKSYIVEKKNIDEWVIHLLCNTLLLGRLFLFNHKNNLLQQHDMFFIIFVSINLLFLFLNIFLGTKKEDKSIDDLSETNK